MQITPAGAMVVGMAAGALSTLGFEYLTPFLDTRLGVRDSCGVHNLHGEVLARMEHVVHGE
eukprot:1137779-Pelagomonas_calceolata.AAC.3